MATVLLVMKRPGNIRVMAQVLEAMGYRVFGTPDHEALDAALIQSERSQPEHARIALVDASGFDATDWRMCQTLQRTDVRFIVLCGANETRHGSRAMSYGAAGLLQKPVKKPLLLQLLSNLVGETSTMQAGEV